MVVLASFYKIRPVHRFVRRNTVDLFAEKVEEILHPLHAKIDRNERQLQEIADALGYQFRPNGGNSLRDRVDGLYHARQDGNG